MDAKKLEKKILEVLNNLETAKLSNKIKAQVLSEEVMNLLEKPYHFFVPQGRQNDQN